MKLYARMLKAECPIDPKAMEHIVPVLQGETVPHAAEDPGFRQIFFFVDRDAKAGEGNVFSITLYDSEEALENAMRDASSEYRFSTLAGLGCSAVDARRFEVVSGTVNPDAAPVDFDEVLH